MSDKVYIVTSGHYSDYRIRGAFVDRAAAEAFTELRNAGTRNSYHDECKIEEWPDNGSQPDSDTSTHWDIDAYAPEYDIQYTEQGGEHWEEITVTDDPRYLNVTARDLDRGLKVMRDLVSKYRAHREGLS